MNKMIIFSAPSGAGKSTIISHLVKSGFGLEFSISATTRAPRGTEKNGVEYYFHTVEEFENHIANNDFVEYEQVYEGRYYGTLKSELDRIWGKGNVVLFDVDVVGGVNLKKKFGEQALSVFVKPPSVEELRKRLIGRSTDSSEEIAKRIAKAEQELSYASQFDKIIVNDDLSVAITDAVNVLSDFLKSK
jgi:guanylate kinase